MSSKIFRQLALSLCAILLSSVAMIGSVTRNQDGVTILITQRPVIPDDAPRSNVPFIAEYYDIWDAVLLGSLENVGNVAVTLSSTAGDWYQTVFNSGGSPILVPVSGASGQYTLTLVTSNGTTYTGEFVL